MTLSPLLLLPMLAWSLSQAPEPADAPRNSADQVNPAEDSPEAGRVTPEQVKLWRKQAAQGGTKAQTNLGLLYSTGDGVPHDPREAIKWFRKAAEQGDGLGQLLLAAKYFEGAGVARDPVKGMAWAILAAEKFHRVNHVDVGHATFSISTVVVQNLTPAEVNQVEQLASELRQKEVSRVKQLDSELRQKIGTRGAFDLRRHLSDQPGSRIVVGLPSTGDEEEKTPPEARGVVNFATIEFVSKPAPKLLPAFTVGIVEANGNLVPIAAFNGRDWSHIDLAEDWINGEQVKSTGEWTLWYERSDPDSPQLSPASIEIATTGLIATEPRCNPRMFVLATDAGNLRESLVTCKYCCPEPKRGIATTSKSRPDLVASLDTEGAAGRSIEARQIKAWILETFNDLEKKRFAQTHYAYDDKADDFINTGKTFAEYLEPRLSAEKRRGLPLELYASSRIQGAHATYYYFEVKRDYYEHLRQEFPAAAYLQGWVRASGDEMVWLTQKFAVTDPDPKEISWDDPILFWRHGNAIDVLSKRSQWESGYYGILRIENDTVNQVTGAGFR